MTSTASGPSHSNGPRLYVISRPSLASDEVARFLNDEDLKWSRTPGAADAEEVVELGGRLCYLSFGERQSPRTNAEYIQNLIDKAHESVLEHATWTFILAGVSRAFTHQLVRHRIGFSYSQLSQQYVDQDDAQVVVPSLVASDPAALRLWEEIVSKAFKTYSDLTDLIESDDVAFEARRALRSAARSLLPEATDTKIAVTANARSLRHFLDLRGALEGDEEMRRVSALVLQMIEAEAPALVTDFVAGTLTDGSPIVRRTGETGAT